MKILLLQNAVHLPSFGGGNKSNRLLLEELAKRGHDCVSISRSVDAQTISDPTSEVSHLAQRGITLERSADGNGTYSHAGVEVLSVNDRDTRAWAALIAAEIDRWSPDIVLVSDDKDGVLLKHALSFAAPQTVAVLHTNFHLPAGNEAFAVSDDRIHDLKRCSNVLTSTRYTREYLRETTGISAQYLPFPVFGQNGFPQYSNWADGSVGMINPCDIKGLPIFVELANRFPDQSLIAVPTWGATKDDLATLSALANVKVLDPADDIDQILKHLSVLLVPSLIPETFGYVAVEAMLRGIPVLASDLGGLRDAKLGTPYLLPVTPARLEAGAYQIPVQDVEPWADALTALTNDAAHYDSCARHSREAALAYVDTISMPAFEEYFAQVQSS